MNNLLSKTWFRIISIILIQSFLILDIAWAGGTQLSVVNPTEMLSAPVQISQQQFAESFDKFYAVRDQALEQQDILADNKMQEKKWSWSGLFQKIADSKFWQWTKNQLDLLVQANSSDKKLNDDYIDIFDGLKSIGLVLIVTAVIALSASFGWAGDGDGVKLESWLLPMLSNKVIWALFSCVFMYAIYKVIIRSFVKKIQKITSKMADIIDPNSDVIIFLVAWVTGLGTFFTLPFLIYESRPGGVNSIADIGSIILCSVGAFLNGGFLVAGVGFLLIMLVVGSLHFFLKIISNKLQHIEDVKVLNLIVKEIENQDSKIVSQLSGSLYKDYNARVRYIKILDKNKNYRDNLLEVFLYLSGKANVVFDDFELITAKIFDCYKSLRLYNLSLSPEVYIHLINMIGRAYMCKKPELLIIELDVFLNLIKQKAEPVSILEIIESMGLENIELFNGDLGKITEFVKIVNNFLIRNQENKVKIVSKQNINFLVNFRNDFESMKSLMNKQIDLEEKWGIDSFQYLDIFDSYLGSMQKTMIGKKGGEKKLFLVMDLVMEIATNKNSEVRSVVKFFMPVVIALTDKDINVFNSYLLEIRKFSVEEERACKVFSLCDPNSLLRYENNFEDFKTVLQVLVIASEWFDQVKTQGLEIKKIQQFLDSLFRKSNSLSEIKQILYVEIDNIDEIKTEDVYEDIVVGHKGAFVEEYSSSCDDCSSLSCDDCYGGVQTGSTEVWDPNAGEPIIKTILKFRYALPRTKLDDAKNILHSISIAKNDGLSSVLKQKTIENYQQKPGIPDLTVIEQISKYEIPSYYLEKAKVLDSLGVSYTVVANVKQVNQGVYGTNYVVANVGEEAKNVYEFTGIEIKPLTADKNVKEADIRIVNIAELKEFGKNEAEMFAYYVKELFFYADFANKVKEIAANLVELKNDKTVDALIAMDKYTSSINFANTLTIISALGQLKDNKAVDFLNQQLKDQGVQERIWADTIIDALEQVGVDRDKSIESLIDACIAKLDNQYSKTKAAYVLQSFGEKAKRALPALRESLANESETTTRTYYADGIADVPAIGQVQEENLTRSILKDIIEKIEHMSLVDTPEFISDLNELMLSMGLTAIEPNQYALARALAHGVEEVDTVFWGQQKYSRTKSPEYSEREYDYAHYFYLETLNSTAHLMSGFNPAQKFGKVIKSPWALTAQEYAESLEKISDITLRYYFSSILKEVIRKMPDSFSYESRGNSFEVLTRLVRLDDKAIDAMSTDELSNMVRGIITSKMLKKFPKIESLLLISGDRSKIDRKYSEFMGSFYKQYSDLMKSTVNYNTRLPRVRRGRSEKDGKDFNFRTRKELKKLEAEGKIVTIEMGGQVYGLPINDFIEPGVEINDLVGAESMFKKGDTIISIKDNNDQTLAITVRRLGSSDLLVFSEVANNEASSSILMANDVITDIKGATVIVDRMIQGLNSIIAEGNLVVLNNGLIWHNKIKKYFPESPSILYIPEVPMKENINLPNSTAPQMQETGRKTVEVYFDKVKQMEKDKEITKIDHKSIRFKMSDTQQRLYIESIRHVMGEQKAEVITPAILFEAAALATKYDHSDSTARIGLQPGTMNPLHFGHISASLAGIISEKLDMVLLANGGTVPDKPYAASADIRNAMAQIAVNEQGETNKLGLNQWLEVTPIRAEAVKMFEQDEALILLTGTEERAKELGIELVEDLRRFNMDMAGFIWLFAANPKVTWVYLVGSDKVGAKGEKGYGYKDEQGLIVDTLAKKDVKIVYFERTGKEIDYENQIKKYPWLDALWKPNFKKSDVGSFADLAAEHIRKALSDKNDTPARNRMVGANTLNHSIPEGVIDYITADTKEGKQLRFLYPLENLDKTADKFSKQGDKEKAFDIYQEIKDIVVAEQKKQDAQKQADESVLRAVIEDLNKKINKLNFKLLHEKLAELAGEDKQLNIIAPMNVVSEGLVMQAI